MRIVIVGFSPRQTTQIRKMAEPLGFCLIDGGSIDDGSNQSRNTLLRLKRRPAWVFWNPGFSRHIQGLTEAAGHRLLRVGGLSRVRKALLALSRGEDPRN